MDTPARLTHNLARRLLAAEAASQGTTDAPAREAVRVCEKLRVSLTRFAGADGFASLLQRALALARVDVPLLQTVKLNRDGSLEGLEVLAGGAPHGEGEAAVAIIGHLLELLVTFVGEPLTLRLVRDAWPGASLE